MRFDADLHYLDNAATTMVDPAVADAIHKAMLHHWANPSSLYDPAVLAHGALSTARAKVAKTLGCQSKELYFTATGTESNNLAILGTVASRRAWGNKIVVSGFEHPSVQLPIRALKDQGFTVVEIMPRADGTLDMDAMIEAVDKNTVLACCMAVNACSKRAAVSALVMLNFNSCPLICIGILPSVLYVLSWRCRCIPRGSPGRSGPR